MEWSFWERDWVRKQRDLLIIGGGFSGLATAYFYKELRPQSRVTVVEKTVFQRAAATRNAGFACISSLSELLTDLDGSTPAEVLQLIEWRWKGLQKLQSLFRPSAIGWEWATAGELFFPDQQYPFSDFDDRIEEANALLNPIFDDPYYQKEASPTGVAKEFPFVKNSKEGRLHPVRLLQAWKDLCRSAGVELIEGWEYLAHEKSEAGLRVETSGGTFDCDQLLFATNGAAGLPDRERQTRPVNNQVLLFPKGSWKGPDLNIHAECGYVYGRNIGTRWLIGGGRHILPEDQQYLPEKHQQEKVRTYLLDFCRKLLPGLDLSAGVEMEWMGRLNMGASKGPLLDNRDNTIFTIARLSGMGVALSATLGEIMARKICAS